MGRSIFRQETQVRPSDAYVDNTAPAVGMETGVDLETDLNNLRSMVNEIMSLQTGNWYDDIATPTGFESASQRGVNTISQDLHNLERKRVLVKSVSLADVTVSASENWVILGTGELPPNTTAALGAVTTLGTVIAAHGGTFGTHSLAEVAGGTAISPKNFVEVVEGSSRDPLLSSGRTIYGLLHAESGVTDGGTITDTTTTRAQVSFVRITATGDDLEAVPVADIENQTVNLCFTERKALDDLTEADFLRGAVTDVPAGATVTRQVAYDNQGTTPVDLTTAATLDLEGAGLTWTIRDDLEAMLFQIFEGSAGGTSEVRIGTDADVFNVDAVDNDFLNGAIFGTTGTGIQVAESAGVIERAADLYLRASGAGELRLDDSYRAGSTWSIDHIALADSSAEWSLFETNFGEVSLMNAINQAYTESGATMVWSVVTVDASADADLSGPANDNNLDTNLGDLSGGTFTTDYKFYWNGQRLRPGADATANHDIYPGTSLANGQIKLEFKAKTGDQLLVEKYV